MSYLTTCDGEITYDCQTELKELFYAYRQLVKGAREVRIEHEGTEVEYRKADLGRLISLYNQIATTCDVPEGYPATISYAMKLGDAGTVTRGRPMRAQFW